MRILITGVTGFAGSHLAEALIARPEYQLFGLSREGNWSESLCHLNGQVRKFP